MGENISGQFKGPEDRWGFVHLRTLLGKKKKKKSFQRMRSIEENRVRKDWGSLIMAGFVGH